jgi:hypothetical protein
MSMVVEQVLAYARVSWAGWLIFYLASCLTMGLLTHLTLHLMAVGLLICLLTYFRLPPPNPSRVLQILGPDPTSNVTNNQIGIVGVDFFLYSNMQIQNPISLLFLYPNPKNNPGSDLAAIFCLLMIKK